MDDQLIRFCILLQIEAGKAHQRVYVDRDTILNNLQSEPSLCAFSRPRIDQSGGLGFQ